MRRDQGRCAVPGCRSSVFVDVHHILPKGEGGTHDTVNLTCMCAAHHRAIHKGQLFVEGTPDSGLVFRHADGSRYGANVCAATAQVMTDVFSALRELGFKETACRQALNVVRPHVGAEPAVDTVLRQALKVMRAGAGVARVCPPGG